MSARLKVRRTIGNGALALFVSLAGAGAVAGQSFEAAEAAYTEGRFLEAADLGEALGDSPGYALAANSLGIHGYYVAPEAERPALYSRGTGLAQEAVRLDPESAFAYLQLGHVLGREAQTLPRMQALRKGYAGKVRDALQNAVRLDPGLAQAHLSLAIWHAEVVDAAGGLIARTAYGARRNTAREHFRLALELAPNDKNVHLEYGNGLLLLDPRGNRDQARAMLSRAVELPSRDAYDRLVNEVAAARLAELAEEG